MTPLTSSDCIKPEKNKTSMLMGLVRSNSPLGMFERKISNFILFIVVNTISYSQACCLDLFYRTNLLSFKNKENSLNRLTRYGPSAVVCDPH